MKILYLVRHAKSSWDFPELDDFDRPLNKRGKRDAPFMGNIFKELKIFPDQVVSSPAVRAFKTAKLVCRELDYPITSIVISENLYETGTPAIIELIRNIDDKINSLMIFGHNPALTLVNNVLCDKRIDNIPTCGLTGIEFQVKSWKDIKTENGLMVLFEFPKKYSL